MGRTLNHVKCTEECPLCAEKNILVKRMFTYWLNMSLLIQVSVKETFNEVEIHTLQKRFSVTSTTFIGGVLPLCRDAVSVVYSPSRLGHVGGLLPLCRVSRCILQPQSTWPFWRSFTPLQRYSRCILQPQLSGPR